MLLIFFGHFTYLWKIDENCPLTDDKCDDLPMIYLLKVVIFQFATFHN